MKGHSNNKIIGYRFHHERYHYLWLLHILVFLTNHDFLTIDCLPVVHIRGCWTIRFSLFGSEWGRVRVKRRELLAPTSLEWVGPIQSPSANLTATPSLLTTLFSRLKRNYLFFSSDIQKIFNIETKREKWRHKTNLPTGIIRFPN